MIIMPLRKYVLSRTTIKNYQQTHQFLTSVEHGHNYDVCLKSLDLKENIIDKLLYSWSQRSNTKQTFDEFIKKNLILPFLLH